MSGVEHRTVGADEAEQRLDRWFRRNFPHVTQGRLEKMCRKGEIRVDGGRAKTATRISPGQTIRIPPLPDGPVPVVEPEPAPLDPALAADLRARVIFRDDHMIVLDKPAGLAVQGGTGQTSHLVGALSALRFGRDEDPRLVHRLDRDTSGVMLLGRTGAATVALARAFRGRSVAKTYIALVAGQPAPLAGSIRWGLVKAGGRGDERMRVVHPDEIAMTEGAKPAITLYRVLESAAGRVSAVALRPVTGRTHQLRAHMAALGTPIAGDGKYGGRSAENKGEGWGASLGGALSRKLHLHAARLAFEHPMTGRRMSFEAPLPEHMQRSWEMLDFGEIGADAEIFEAYTKAH